MRVVHVGEYVSGGVATYLRTLVKVQSKNPSIDDIYIFKAKNGSEKLEFESNKVHVIEYDYQRSAMGIFKLVHLWRAIKSLNPDIVHLHSTFAGLLRLKSLVIKPKFKIIYCAHGWAFIQDSGQIKKYVYALVERILSYGCNAIINVSENERIVAEHFGLPANKMTTITNSIEFPAHLPSKKPNKGRLRILYIGRFDRAKGVDILIDAAKKLPDFDFKLAGKSIIDGMVIEDKTLPDNIKLLGWLTAEEVDKQILESDAVIIPSRWEAFGLSAVEAMKNGTAVLASSAGGLPYVVQNGVTGLLFDADSSEAIVNVLSSVNRHQLLAFGAKGQAVAANKFDANDMERKISEMYMN